MPRLKIPATLVMFSPSCKCLSHLWGIFFLPCTAVNPHWSGALAKGVHGSIPLCGVWRMAHAWACTAALICVWWTQPPLGQVKGFEGLMACAQGPSWVSVWELSTARSRRKGAGSISPSCSTNTGQAHLLSAQPVLAVSLGTHHLPTSSRSDLMKVMPRWMRRDAR